MSGLDNKMTMKIELRKCMPSDWRTLQRFGRAIFRDTFADMNTPENLRAYLDNAFGEKSVKEELANPDSEFWLALAEGEVAGYLKVNFRSAQMDLQDENSMEVQRIYVSKDFQGQGVAQILMEKARELAAAAAVDFIWLGVWEHNPRAIRFYEKMGFESFSSHTFLMGDEEQTDILMKLKFK